MDWESIWDVVVRIGGVLALAQTYREVCPKWCRVWGRH